MATQQSLVAKSERRVTLLYLVRHGDKDKDALNEEGWREARALVDRMRDAGLTHAYSSPANRAQCTAKPTCDALGLTPQVRPWLMEADFLQIQQEGRKYCIWDAFGENVRSPESLAAITAGPDGWLRVPPFNTPEVASTWRNFCDSIDALLQDHGYSRDGAVYRVVQPRLAGATHTDRIALFCHNGTLLFLVAHLLQLPPPLVFSGFFCWPSSVTTICMEQQSDGIAVPRCLGLADVSHLSRAGLQPVPRGMGHHFQQWV
eukprot:TRINITY_DN17127_c0_g1_i1.p1 TRINITY_DN17127_c0_g1~~TRINITY_DN17127_c0_g1_i1.p1  ORF type:complete len:276 (-),score=73.55 TRINITY_DN17127_c0_g1_i1:64-843(-)